MLKRLTALLIALTLLLSAASALGESTKTPAESTAEMMSYLHFSFVSMLMVPDLYADEEACFNDMVLLELMDHSYPYPAYRSHDEAWDAVFIPDDSGARITSVQLLADAASVGKDFATFQKVACHVLGLCSPCWVNEDATAFADSFMTIYTQALSFTSNLETDPIDYNGIRISCYHYNTTFGVILEYPVPVNNSVLMNNSVVTALMLSSVSEGQ